MEERPGDERTGRPPAGPRLIRWGLGDFFGLYLAGLVGSGVGVAIGSVASGDKAGHAGALTLALAIAGQYGTWAVGLFIISRTKGSGSVVADFGLVVAHRRLWALLAGVACQIVLSAMVSPLVHLVHNDTQEVVDTLSKAHGAKLAVLTIAAAFVAPVLEEVFYRGLLLRSLCRRFSPETAICLSALIFAATHLLDGSLGTVAVLPALFALGVISGIAAVRVGDLSVSIPLHIGFNLVTVASVYAFVR